MKFFDKIKESLPFVRRSEYEEVVEKLESLLSEVEVVEEALEKETVWSRQKIEQLQDELNKSREKQIRTSLYDKEEIHRNCTVHILSNSVTGEQSIGWFDNDNPPIGADLIDR